MHIVTFRESNLFSLCLSDVESITFIAISMVLSKYTVVISSFSTYIVVIKNAPKLSSLLDIACVRSRAF